MPNKTTEIFVSYAPEDKGFLNELIKHLISLKRTGLIKAWHHGEIAPGSEWATQIDSHLESAGIILLLISADFLHSEHCFKQMDQAMERHEAGEAIVMPIILRDVDWADAPFSKLQVFPKNEKSITRYPNVDQAFTEIVREIRSQVNQYPNPNSGLGPSHCVNLTYYVDRGETEIQCFRAIQQAGALLRIKAPTRMGKTYLAARIVKDAKNHVFETVFLSFELADKGVFEDSTRFVQWFCGSVGNELGLENQINVYWEEVLSCNYNTTNYFQKYLLAHVTHPVLLVLDNTDLVFEHPELAWDFCKLLRNWHDQARRGDRHSQVWEKLRLIIIHATEIYGLLDINASPLAGAGDVIDLPELNQRQVKTLAQKYGVCKTINQIQELMDLVGGHPYLLNLALKHIQETNITLDQFLQEAPTENGIYGSYLRQLSGNLEKSPELLRAFNEIIMSEYAISIKRSVAFSLYRLGLIKTLDTNRLEPRCLLYYQYFHNYFCNP